MQALSDKHHTLLDRRDPYVTNVDCLVTGYEMVRSEPIRRASSSENSWLCLDQKEAHNVSAMEVGGGGGESFGRQHKRVLANS